MGVATNAFVVATPSGNLKLCDARLANYPGHPRARLFGRFDAGAKMLLASPARHDHDERTKTGVDESRHATDVSQSHVAAPLWQSS